jgi:hypothetical protein
MPQVKYDLLIIQIQITEMVPGILITQTRDKGSPLSHNLTCRIDLAEWSAHFVTVYLFPKVVPFYYLLISQGNAFYYWQPINQYGCSLQPLPFPSLPAGVPTNAKFIANETCTGGGVCTAWTTMQGNYYITWSVR